MDGAVIDGRVGSLHFIRFPTAQMEAFAALARGKGMAELASTLCATGGGAYKFQALIEKAVELNLHKFDEIDSLVRGLDYMGRSNSSELFFYDNPQDPEHCQKTIYNSEELFPFLLVNIGSGVSILSVRVRFFRSLLTIMRHMHFSFSLCQGPEQYQRVCGTSLGGGTFLGLCSLLTDCKTFEEALNLAAKGDNKNVDKLVKDIYGGDYDR